MLNAVDISASCLKSYIAAIGVWHFFFIEKSSFSFLFSVVYKSWNRSHFTELPINCVTLGENFRKEEKNANRKNFFFWTRELRISLRSSRIQYHQIQTSHIDRFVRAFNRIRFDRDRLEISICLIRTLNRNPSDWILQWRRKVNVVNNRSGNCLCTYVYSLYALNRLNGMSAIWLL